MSTPDSTPVPEGYRVVTMHVLVPDHVGDEELAVIVVSVHDAVRRA